jgi:hypothetical protein
LILFRLVGPQYPQLKNTKGILRLCPLQRTNASTTPTLEGNIISFDNYYDLRKLHAVGPAMDFVTAPLDSHTDPLVEGGGHEGQGNPS